MIHKTEATHKQNDVICNNDSKTNWTLQHTKHKTTNDNPIKNTYQNKRKHTGNTHKQTHKKELNDQHNRTMTNNKIKPGCLHHAIYGAQRLRQDDTTKTKEIKNMIIAKSTIIKQHIMKNRTGRTTQHMQQNTIPTLQNKHEHIIKYR